MKRKINSLKLVRFIFSLPFLLMLIPFAILWAIVIVLVSFGNAENWNDVRLNIQIDIKEATEQMNLDWFKFIEYKADKK